jgi:hypothetical protein
MVLLINAMKPAKTTIKQKTKEIQKDYITYLINAVLFPFYIPFLLMISSRYLFYVPSPRLFLVSVFMIFGI